MDRKIFVIKNRITGELVDTVIASHVRDDGKFYDFFSGNNHKTKINKKSFYYEEMKFNEPTNEELAEEEERENARFLDPEEDFKIYYDEFQG